MPKYLDMHGLETLTGDIENTYLKKNQRGAAGGVASLDSNGKVPTSQIPGGAGGTTDYDDLTDKPQINGVTLSGNKTSANLGLANAENPNFTGSINMGRAENTTVGEKSTATGTSVTASGSNAHAEGGGTTASGNQAHAEGGGTTASGTNAHSEGAGSEATNSSAHAEGTGTTASGDSSHSEGNGTTASGYGAHAEGSGTTASGLNAHAEGGATSATMADAHAEGEGTQANANSAHAEGSTTRANGSSSHSEGGGTIANGGCAHAEGSGTTANGASSHAEGGGTVANGAYSHVGGRSNVPDDYSSWAEWTANANYAVGDKVKRTVTENNETTVTGYICKTPNNDSTFDSSKWDVDLYMNYAEIIGNGSPSTPSNARTLDWDGNEALAGDLTLKKGTADEFSVSELKTEITKYTGNQSFNDYVKDKWIKYTAPQTISNESGWECILVQCNPGDVFNVKGYSGASPRLWCFSDSQGNALSYSAISTITSEYIEIVAPANAAYLACNSKYSEIKGGLIKGKILKKQVDELEDAYKKSGFNQIVVGGDFESASGWLGNGSPSWTLEVSNNVLTATVKSRAMKLQRPDDYPSIKVGHKYYASAEYYGSDFETVDISIGNSASYGATTANTWNRISAVLKAASVNGNSTDCQFEVKLINNYTAQSMQIRNYWVVDLTEMYGEGNEPTAAEFLQMYGESYYPYLNVPHDPKVTDYVVKKQVNPLLNAAYESIVPDGFEPGYLSSDGTISSQGGTTLEVTSTPIYDIYSATISVVFSESKAQWCAFCAYNNKGQKVGDRQTVSITGKELSGVFTFPEDAVFIRFSFRTYGGGYTLDLKGIHSSAKESKRLNVVSDRTINILANRGKPCYHHLFVQNSSSHITIPHQSQYDVRASKRFGFNMIEGNVQKTSDSKYMVNHLETDNKFGRYFVHVDGVTDVSNITVGSKTWEWITQNLRYKSSIAKYRTAPCSLEEFLSECKQNDLIPFITITDATIKSIADKYMGKDNYVAYTGSRLYCPNTTCYAWRSEASKDAIVKFCLKMGKPLIYGMANPGSFTDSELREIVDALHELGFMIGTAYQDTNWHKYSAMGFDFVAGMGMVNRMESGNLYNFNSIFNFNDFTVTGATETDGVLVFSSSGSIVPNANDSTYQLAMIDVEIVFNGEITLNAIGEQYNNITFTSDGSKPIFMAIPIVNGGIKPTINVSSGTTVYEVTYLASVV